MKRNKNKNEDKNLNYSQSDTFKENDSKQNKNFLHRLLKSINKNLTTRIFFYLLGFITASFYFMLTDSTLNSLAIDSNLLKINEKNKNFHKLAIVVPFRERFDELLVFVPHLSNFLNLKSIDFKIYIINQVDDYRFNRAALINVGYLISMNECAYMAMHDVDLLPLNDLIDYSYPKNGPYHVSAPGLHPEYNYSNFIGGILIVSREDFLKTNGMSNRYFGWGKEDDEFYLRLKEANLTVNRPDVNKFKTKDKFTFFHNHDPDKRPRDKKRYLKQKRESLRLDKTGLNNIQYKIKKINNILIENYACTIVNVELLCDRSDTHWCSTDYQFYD